MRRVLAISRKETRQFLRDRLSLVVALVLPLVLMALFGTALSTSARNLRLAVEDLDNTPLSRRYLDAYAATGNFVIVNRPGDASLEQLLDGWHARAVLRIPAGFERDYRSGRGAEVQVLVDGTGSNTAVILRNVSAAIAQDFQAIRGAAPPVRVRTRHWYNPGLSDRVFFGSGAFGLVLVLFPSLLGAIAAARELELGTAVQAYASSLSAPEWVIGKALPYVAVGAVQLVLCFWLGMFLFGYRIPEHPAPLAAACLLYLAAAVLFGMMAGHLTGTQSAAIQAVQLGAFLLSMLLSGFLVPVANMPAALRLLSLLVPARHFIEVTRDTMLRGAGWEMSAQPVLFLAGLALLLFAVNVGRMRRMQVGA